MVKQVPEIEIHDENARIVKGWGTVDVFDKAGERLPIEEFKRIMPIIMKRGGIVMNRHTNQPAAKILNYEFKIKDTKEGPKEGVYLTTEAFNDFKSDDDTWKGIKDQEIQGFSFGGRNNKEELDFSKGLTRKVLKEIEGFEFSYVPKGCNQEATIEEVNYIAKEDVEKEEGETSTDLDHYHLYRIDDAGNGQTLNTLPREAEDHNHKIDTGIVQVENGHDHKLVRKLVKKEEVQKPFAGFKDFDACVLANKDKDDPAAFCGYLKSKVEKIDEEFEKEKIQKKNDSIIEKEESEVADDKKEKENQSKDDSTLLKSDNKDESFIKGISDNKSMAEKDEKKETKKVEEAPMAEESTPTEDPIVSMNSKLDQIISLLSNVQKADKKEDDEEETKKEDKEEEKPKDDKDVEKDEGGEKVKLPESAGDETSQEKPAEDAKADEGAANFLKKEDLEKIKADVRADIMKELIDKKADTPRAGTNVNNNIKKAEDFKAPKNSLEANKMIKAAGLK